VPAAAPMTMMPMTCRGSMSMGLQAGVRVCARARVRDSTSLRQGPGAGSARVARRA
jgi:hypothetical protein